MKEDDDLSHLTACQKQTAVICISGSKNRVCQCNWKKHQFNDFKVRERQISKTTQVSLKEIKVLQCFFFFNTLIIFIDKFTFCNPYQVINVSYLEITFEIHWTFWWQYISNTHTHLSLFLSTYCTYKRWNPLTIKKTVSFLKNK